MLVVTCLLVAAALIAPRGGRVRRVLERVRPDRLRPSRGLSAGCGSGAGRRLAVRGSGRSESRPAPHLRLSAAGCDRLVPLTWLPADLAAFLVFLASVAALLGAVALVGVRDVRCYAAVLLWAPTWNSLDTLNVSLGARARRRSPLAVSLDALAARCDARSAWCRSSCSSGPCSSGSGLTRRPPGRDPRARLGFGITLASWAAIGFAGLADYPGPPLPGRRPGELLDRRRSRTSSGSDRSGPASRRDRRRCASRRGGLVRGRRRARGSRVHARGRREPRAEPCRVAALPHAVDRAARARAPALLAALAPADSAVGEPA